MTTIDVYADIWCPFTHVGLKRLLARRFESGSTTALRVWPWPLELINEAPLDAGFIAEEVDDLRSQVAGDLFRDFQQERFPTTTLPALALAEAAYSVGLAEGEAMSVLLRDALFEDGKDISDPAILSGLAKSIGTPPATDEHASAVTAAWTEGQERGVVGSPHFFTPGGGYFCPALDIKRVEGHLRIQPDLVAFEAFAASCFDS